MEINKKDYIEDKIFNRGFFLTTNNEKLNFFNNKNWQKQQIGKLNCYFQKNSKYYISQLDNEFLLLIGHAYDPVLKIFSENEILENILKQKENRIELLNNLTGLFVIISISEDRIKVFGDPAGIKCVYYGNVNNFINIASHTLMFNFIYNLCENEYITKLKNSRFYHLFGKTLPSDLTPYKNITRLIPNHSATFDLKTNQTTIARFFPTKVYAEYNVDEISNKITYLSTLLSNNLEMISKKWEAPAISLTGGCDSKTTLSSAKGLYNKFKYFSYVSTEAENVDAQGAKIICDNLNLKHIVYNIPNDDNDFLDIEKIRNTIKCNTGDIGKSNKNDIRKRAFLSTINDFDVEVKSWVSEVGRAYYSKRFLIKNFPKKVKPRYLSTMYKVFLPSKLLKQTDKYFKDYIDKYLSTDKCSYPWQELFFWEFRMSSWNGLVITGEHEFSNEITIPYNNRRILDILLRMPLDYRINDTAYKMIRQLNDKKIDESGIFITNLKHTSRRAKFEKLYLLLIGKMLWKK